MILRLRGVGECCIEAGAQRIGPESELAFALLLVLVLNRGRPVARQQLIDLLWPATSGQRARHNLRQTLYKLGKLGIPLCADPHDIRLAAGTVQVDPLLEANADAPLPAELLRPDAPFGEFLAGYAPAVSAAFARWVDEQRAVMHGRLRRLVTGALLDERRRGSWGSVETLARKALQLDPLNEEATLALAEATALTGSKRVALGILDRFLEELGAGEEAELRLPASLLRRRIADRLLPVAALADADSCFVGRAESMTVLTERFRQVRQGAGQALLVWGDQGIGKSRLAGEFASLATLDGARVVRVPCQPRDVERPLSVFVDGVPELLLLPGALGCSPESMAYLKRLTDHDPDMLEPSAETREAELLFAGVRRSILDLVDAVAGEAPLVLWIEDVHWLDAQSWRVLREMIDWLGTRALFLLLTSRLPHATPAPPARAAAGLGMHRVPALAEDPALRVLLDATAGRDPPPAFRDWCLQVAEGNPFHLRSLAHHWTHTGDYRAPASLRELVVARLQRLPELPLRTLQACAVLAKNATAARLEAVLEYRRHALLDALAHLEGEGLLAVTGQSVPCRHSLISDAALSMLPDATRRLMHRCAARVLQLEIERSQSASLLWDCAQQWEAAGEADQALRLVRSCGTHLLEMGLPSDAAEVYEQAVGLCELEADKLDMLERLKLTLVLCGEWSRVGETIERILSMKYSDDPDKADFDADRVLAAEAQWRSSATLDGLAKRMLDYSADRRASPRNRLRATTLALAMADNACDEALVIEAHSRSLPLLRAPNVSRLAAVQFTLMYHTAHGDLNVARTAADELQVLARRQSDVGCLMRALRYSGVVFRRVGEFARAEDAYDEALAIADRYRLTTGVLLAAEGMILAKLEQDLIEEASLWYDHAVLAGSAPDESATIASIESLGVRIALEEQDLVLAQQRYSSSLVPIDTDASLRRYVGLLALRVRLFVALERMEALIDPMKKLENAFALTKSWGGQDFVVSSLVHGLQSVGRAADGQFLLAQYLATSRRELYPFGAHLLPP